MLAKAATSNLTAADVKALKFEPYAEDHPLQIYPSKLAGFKIPYFNLDGSVDEDFYRFRMLQEKPSKGWASLVTPTKPPRYTQLEGSGNHIYLPPINGLRWQDIANDPSISIAITEGELKAACACKYGPATIGLGGVYNWKSAKQGQTLLPILKLFAWQGRRVTICFDSDINTNAMVAMAAGRLAHELTDRGAKMYLVKIPPTETGEKQGLDDLIYTTGDEEALYPIFAAAEDIGSSAVLYQINSQVAYIHATDELVELAYGKVMTPSAFMVSAYSHYKYSEQVARPDGSMRMVSKPAPRAWLDWPHRNTVSAQTYAPECPAIITPDGMYNVWAARGWGCKPSDKGSLEPWNRLFNNIFGGLSAEHLMWLKRWFAYPIQHPGQKMSTAVLCWGFEQGTGKSRIGEAMKCIYGAANSSTITKHHIESEFTDWIQNKQFIMSNELAITNKRELSEVLKELITQPSVRVNEKHKKQYEAPDHANYYFTTNKSDSLYLEPDDRRFFVCQAVGTKMTETEYTEFSTWLNQGGAERLHYNLRYEVDLADFNPYAAAPVTRAKLEMIGEGYSDIDAWCIDLLMNTEKVLPRERYPYALFTAEELLKVYSPDEKNSKATALTMSKALKRAGVLRVGANGAGDTNIYINNKQIRARLFAPRGGVEFKSVSAARAGALYDEEHAAIKLSKFIAPSARIQAARMN